MLPINNSLEKKLLSISEAAETFEVPYSTIAGVYRKNLDNGKISRKKQTKFKGKKLDDDKIKFIQDKLDEDATYSLKELQEFVLNHCAILVSISTIENYIKLFHYSFKRIQKIAEAVTTPANAQMRRDHSVWFLRVYASERMVIYLDEVGFQVSMRRHYGRSLKGKRAQKVVKNIKTRNITVIAGMTSSSLFYYKILETPGNTINFLEYITDLMAYLLIGNIENAVLVLDNCSIHRSLVIRELVERNGHELKFLPPYCPFFNPIENLFSQWKNLVGRDNPKTEDELFTSIHEIQNTLTSDQCKHYVDHVYHNAVSCLEGGDVFDT